MTQKKPKKQFQSPTGMRDVLPEDHEYFTVLAKKVEEIAQFYRFGKIETPIVEDTELFTRGVGQATDVVEKQMYTFRTKGGDSLTLRPEGTAPTARAFIQHGMLNMPQPVKLYYEGKFFRYERPQQGRLREFHQFGFEVFGEISPVIDAHLIQIAYTILREAGLRHVKIEINSLGDSFCRPYFKKLLVNYLRNRVAALCVDCRRRLKTNPLRVLDCKEERCIQVKSQTPQIIDHLCQACHTHFKGLLEILDELEVPYELNPYLVRGLDYYTKTVFEIFVTREKGEGKGEEKDENKEKPPGEEKDAKTEKPPGEEEPVESFRADAVGGGGRYDTLVKLLGGKETPACGFAVGIERVIARMKEAEIVPQKPKETAVFLAQLGDLAKKKSLRILEELRKARIAAGESIGKDSLKSQLHIADKLGAKLTIILGQEEVLRNSAILREMQSGSQETVKLDKLVEEVKKRLKSK